MSSLSTTFKSARCAVMLSAGLVASAAAAAEGIVIDVQSDPPLPLRNLLQNGGFENGLEGWTPMAREAGWQAELSDDAFQGTHSLHVKVSEEARHHGRGVTQSLYTLLEKGVMAKGRSYFVSCWMKGVGVSDIGGDYCGAGATLSFYGQGWKRSSSVHAMGGDTGGGWVKLVSEPIKGEAWAKGGEAAAGIFYSTGEAWFDEVCVSEATLTLKIKVSGGPFRQVLVESERGDVLFDSGRLPERTTTFAKDLETVCGSLFTVSALGDDGKITRKVLDGAPVKANPLMVVDGKPFFPIGTEVIGYRPEERDEQAFRKICAELKGAGFNVVADYTATNKYYPFEPSLAQRNLRIAGENGLRTLVAFHDAMRTRKSGETGKTLLEKIIPLCKNDPALLGWWIVDEPTATQIPEATELYHLAKALDKEHVVYTNISPFAYLPKGDEEMGDAFSGDGYPIHKVPEYGALHDKYITAAADCLLTVSRPFAGKKPVFYWVQGFGETASETHACPTYEQIRFMAYDVIAHGASGVFFWTLSMDGRPPWADVKRVASELRQLYPALVAPDTGESVWVNEHGSKVMTWFRVCGRKAYVIAVNRGEDAVSATLVTPMRFTKARRLFEPESPLQTAPASLQDTFGRYGCHAYELDI